MSLVSVSNQTVALAGIAQACSLVRELATTGNADLDAMSASITSVLKIDSDSVIDVYAGINGIRHGLEQLDKQLTNRVVANPEQARYAAQLVHLQKQLSQNHQMMNQIQIGITKAQAQSEHFGVMHENVLANLADVYHSTISTMQPRIMINGDPQHLSNPIIVNKIRSLLLAGIRASLLWRQCGGSRWHLLFHRKKLQDEAKRLLATV
ncbi:MAG: lysogenization regulator HflD [Methylomonas sp.]|jgi:high frequency lysogenization protein|nr:MAG: lysogenization regulator HflD [Methylomonas sp.]